MHFDVFNGDADGILSLLQLRLANPIESRLVTGVKRDIQLLKKVDGELADSVTVLDISMEKNIAPLEHLLSREIKVAYFDHHRAPEIPDSPFLNAHIDTDANVCTALLVDKYLQGAYGLWAVTAAFGDNLKAAGAAKARQLGLDQKLTEHLERLGTAINYNGYGRTVADLHYAPDELFKLLLPFDTPEALVADKSSLYYQLWDAYQTDIAKAESAEVVFENDACKLVLLPDEPWSNRVSGVYGNLLANNSPDRAHGVLTLNADGQSYTVSVRAPLNNKQGAGELCSGFPTGGGRAAAAGINALPQAQLDEFVDQIAKFWG